MCKSDMLGAEYQSDWYLAGSGVTRPVCRPVQTSYYASTLLSTSYEVKIKINVIKHFKSLYICKSISSSVAHL